MAKNLSINVYLKLKPDNRVETLIAGFNQFLNSYKIFKIFSKDAYLHRYPLHITLYLTDYEEQQIPLVIKRSKLLARQRPILVTTGQFLANPRGYIMLSLISNKRLQHLSNRILYSLMDLRNKETLIPAWASEDRKRRALFNQFGSPGVLNYFKPHFSVMEAQLPDSQISRQLQQLVHQFNQHYTTRVNAVASAIGVGIANTQGQIVKELACFELGQ